MSSIYFLRIIITQIQADIKQTTIIIAKWYSTPGEFRIF